MNTAQPAPRYLLDTHFCIDLINRKPADIFQRFEGLNAGDVAISSITGAELHYGVEKSSSKHNQQALEKFLAPLDVLPFDTAAMHHYGQLRAQLNAQGARIAPLDLLIAAHAHALACTLVSSKPQSFEGIAGLNVENWLA